MDAAWMGLILLAGLFVLYWVCRLTLSWKQKRPLKSAIWEVDLKKIFLLPLKVLFFTLGIYFAFMLSKDFLPFQYDLKPLKDFVVLLSLFWIVYRWKKELFQKRWSSLSMAEMLDKLSSFVFSILFILMSMNIFHLDILPLLAFGGIGAAALGFAAKDVLSNFFGGVMISITRPFAKGEIVYLPDRKLEGTVEEMGWYSTSIRDKDKRPIYFPNSLFSSIPVINISRMSHRRIYETFRFSYQDFSKVIALTQTLREHLSKNTQIDPKMPLLVYWDRVAEYSLEVVLDIYVLTTQTEAYVLVRESILQEVFAVFDQMQIEVSYPVSIQKKF